MYFYWHLFLCRILSLNHWSSKWKVVILVIFEVMCLHVLLKKCWSEAQFFNVLHISHIFSWFSGSHYSCEQNSECLFQIQRKSNKAGTKETAFDKIVLIFKVRQKTLVNNFFANNHIQDFMPMICKKFLMQVI